MKSRIALLLFVAVFASAMTTACRNTDPAPAGHAAGAR